MRRLLVGSVKYLSQIDLVIVCGLGRDGPNNLNRQIGLNYDKYFTKGGY